MNMTIGDLYAKMANWIGSIPLPIALVLAVDVVLFALLAFATHHDRKALEEKYKDI